MGIKELIKEFSAGKIEPKYHIVSQTFSKRKRNIIAIPTAIICITLPFLIYKGIFSDNSYGWVLVSLFMFFIIIPPYIIYKITHQYKIIGKLRFFSDHLSIEHSSEKRTLNYSEILRINYCGGLPKNNNHNLTPRYITYKVKIFLSSKEEIILEAKEEMFFGKKDNGVFRANPPTILTCINALNPRYGIVADAKI